ncbi:MAG: type VI secretion system protein TssA [Candidatus Eisenbacteria bacterium]|nr:type VI secretion system protein TssA [Candidatus Eisenbacteria bacterium]
MSAADYLELGRNPVRDGAPGGESCRDDQDFESIQLEVRKLELPDGSQPNWETVVQLGTKLLKDRSKDLLVAAWVTVGLFTREGYAGLAVGLAVMRDLVDLHWDVLFPEVKRLKGRVAAFEWTYERILREIGRRTPNAAEREAIAECAERLKELDGKLSDKVEGGGPNPADIRRALEDAASQVAAPAPQAASAAPTSSAASAGGSGAAVTTSVASAAEVPQALGNARSILRAAAECLRREEPANPLGYRLPRIAAWMHLIAPPPHQDGQTSIPAPPPDQLEKLEQMLGAGQYPGVLQMTEERLGTAVFWLDLNRYAAAALEAMGPAFQVCAQAVVDETALLLRRFPVLKELRFAGGAPVANPATQQWLATRVLAAGEGAGPGGGAAAPAAGDDLDGLAEACAKSRELVGQRRIGEAIRLLEEGAQGARTLRARAHWKLEVSRICMSQNYAETALHHLEALDQEIQGSRAEDWDAGLCIEVLKTLFQSHQKVLSSIRPIPPEELQKSRLLLGRLSRLDVVSALAFEPKR